MKYFFLSQGWRVRRVWEVSGLWNEMAWRRRPIIAPIGIYLVDGREEMVLYKVEEAIQAVEAIPEELPRSGDRSVNNNSNESSKPVIAQVRISRLLSAEQALERITPLR
ncbi:MAG: hypothetical protein DCF19_23865 [Pseudanabaena frigida]|uniref:Uncharacterized protein n=1 Tax=Pseudanabaena frigida TaxID=945775 RepID=A0A2W4W0C0_9CYAN|nr:MAG: hypothetical protein DCF19_23865 [Pseudanabaena frigida]